MNPDFCVEGIVIKKQHGKDGYEATIRTSDKKEYIAVASYANSGEQYKMVFIGDSVKICCGSDDTFTIRGTLHLLARYITVKKT